VAREPTKRELAQIRSLRRKAGGRDELIRWIDSCPELPRGAPRNKTLQIFLDMIAEYHGHDWIHKVGGRKHKFSTPIPTIRHYVEKAWKSDEKMYRDKSLPPAVRAAYNPRRLGKSINAVTRRLHTELQKRAKREE
jgi:hypothetical protein